MSQRPGATRSRLMNQDEVRIPFHHLEPSFARLAREAETHHGIMKVADGLLAGSATALSAGAVGAAAMGVSPLMTGLGAAVGFGGAATAIGMPQRRVKTLHDLMEAHLREGKLIVGKEHRAAYSGFTNGVDATRTHKFFKVEDGEFVFSRKPQDKVAYERQEGRWNRRVGLTGRQRIGYLGPRRDQISKRER